MRSGWISTPIPLIVAALLLIVGTVVLVRAGNIPARTNVATYEETIEEIARRWSNNEIQADKASRLFHAVQDRHATNKWLLADLGYLALALGAAIGLLAALFRESLMSRLTHTHSWKTTALVGLTAASLLCAAAVASAHHEYARGLLPPWADTLAVAYADGIVLFIIALLLLALTCLPPHALRRSNGASLLVVSRPPLPIAFAANLVFFPLACFACFYAIVYGQWSGAWLATLAFLLVAWLFLHARGVLLAPPKESAAVDANRINA